MDVEESYQTVQEYTLQVKELQVKEENALEEVSVRREQIASQVSEIEVTPYKKDIQVELFSVACLPYNLAQAGIQIFELEGFSGAVQG